MCKIIGIKEECSEAIRPMRGYIVCKIGKRFMDILESPFIRVF